MFYRFIVKSQRSDDKVKSSRFNPEFAVAIYYGLQILAATLVYCFYHPVLLMGPQRETIGTFVPYLLHPPDESKLPVSRVVVCDTILLLNIIMIMPASHRQNALRQRQKACSEIKKIKNRLALSYKSLQLRVSLRFTSPRYDPYCKIWV
jgi:hypothetical protein